MSHLTGYLGLSDRLSQIWLNTYSLALILIVLKLIFFTKSIRDNISLVQEYTLSHCEDIDLIYSNTLSRTPHYLGIMGNFMIEKTMIETIDATLEITSMLVYASEELLSFVVDLYVGTYACLIVSAIDGTVDVATNTSETLIKFVNSSIITIADELDDGLTDISDFLNKIISAASKIEDFFDGDDDDGDEADDKISKVNLTISMLKDLQIPTSINDKLNELSEKTPDFATVKNKTKSLISIPFQKVRNEIATINGTSIIGDQKLLYIPPLSNDSSIGGGGICRPNKQKIVEIFSLFTKSLQTITIIVVVLIVLASIIVTLPSAWREYKLWKRLEQMHSQYLFTHYDPAKKIIAYPSNANSFEENSKEKAYDVVASYYLCFQRWSSCISTFIMKSFSAATGKRLQNSTALKIQWVVSYLTSERALLVLGIGMLALLTCICQFIIIAVCRSLLKDPNYISLGILSNSSSIETSLRNDMNVWAQSTNLYISSTENNVNMRAFGWINETTMSVNSTTNKMLSDIDGILQDAFNGSILYSPMNTIMTCTIGNKLKSIEKALTWINNKAQVKLPRVDPSQVQALVDQIYEKTTNSNNQTSSTVSASSTLNAVTDEISTTLLKILSTFHESAVWETVVAMLIIAIWSIQLPIALAILICRMHMFKFTQRA